MHAVQYFVVCNKSNFIVHVSCLEGILKLDILL